MIWLVGARGMLGREIALRLDSLGLAHLDTDLECDIADADAIEGFAGGRAIDWVVNCAAYTAVDRAESDVERAFRVNADGPGNLALLCRRCGAAIVHISTDYVFDGDSTSPYREEDPVNPRNAYGRSKAEGETRVRQATDRSFIFRTAWLYGLHGANFVFTMLRLMRKQRQIGVVADQHGSPTYAPHLASAVCEFIARGSRRFGIYHFTNTGETTWYGFAREIYRLGLEQRLLCDSCEIRPLRTEEYPTPAKRPRYSVLATEKIAAELGMRAPGWREGLSEFFACLDGARWEAP